MSIEPTNVSNPRRNPEDSAAGCRMMASDDRERAALSDSAHMGLRLLGSADAWTARAELLDRIEANRVRMNNHHPPAGTGKGTNGDG